LGAGKTHLVKGLAAGNGATDPRKVTSPTFTLIHEYSGRLRLHHIDAYRLRGPSELIALGFDELIGPESVVAVEWADRVRSAMPADTLWIEISAFSETGRRFTFRAAGPTAGQCLKVFVDIHDPDS
jgi:tRNA threonylcarbamoyladenosine biosynthesis protein TsaE